ncbi:2c05ebcb-dcb6-423c-b5a2-22d586ad1e86 [Thermothielavioides terrestris]|uniref:2c05ebcb-dcb6-423c-b5a2-22d586ad1e86 n=1 Tax=Thermothielavioides terrestris TaxID=2587410 RepID=A0A3S4BH30_9PEZI|nr:2c05ebcb-dcb6-423c-b5a2-22d586ad1e86 [Thermothielavioides terrestris]
MDHSLDQTTLATISLLEARLLRIEHILYGPSTPPTEPPAESATTSLAELEHRFNQLLRHFRVYAEILKISVRATVLAYASAFPTTASALTAATTDTPVPDAQQSAALAALGPRLRAVAALQRAQSAEMAALRRRSERALRAWYEGGVLRYGDVLADVEGRFEKVERAVRRAARAREEEGKV